MSGPGERLGGSVFGSEADQGEVEQARRRAAAGMLAREQSSDQAVVAASTTGGTILGAVLGALATAPTLGIINPASGASIGGSLAGGIASIAVSDEDEERKSAALNAGMGTAAAVAPSLGKAFASSFDGGG